MDREEITKMIQESHGKIFGVTFKKRTTGEIRNLNGRLKVRKYISGKGLAFEPNEKNLIVCYDLKKKGYRMIPIEGIISFRFQGQETKVE